MNGKGWQPEYGISEEGRDILGFAEALPQEARMELAARVELFCRSQGYLSLHDNLTRLPSGRDELTEVIPLRTLGL